MALFLITAVDAPATLQISASYKSPSLHVTGLIITKSNFGREQITEMQVPRPCR